MFLADALKEIRDLANFFRDRGQSERAEAYEHAALIVSKLDAAGAPPAPASTANPIPKELLGGPRPPLSIPSNVVRCKKCGHQWTPRSTRVFRCARCKSPYWNIEPVEKPG